MASKTTAAYGTWRSGISADLIVQGALGLSSVSIDAEDVYWIEMRPAERGRYAIVRRNPSGIEEEILPAEMSARTRVHEYGGGAYCIDKGRIIFSNFTDQRLYFSRPRIEPEPLTPPGEFRYADAIFDDGRNQVICVREDHDDPGREATNKIVAINLTDKFQSTVLASGRDFYSTPRLSPDGQHLAWLEWDHPNMPWDGTELCLASIESGGSLNQRRVIAGGPNESIFQPEWSPDGVLHFVSDRTGWWNLYQWREDHVEALWPTEAEFGRPQWGFGMRMYAFADRDRIVCIVTRKAIDSLAIYNRTTRTLQEIDVPFTSIGSIRANPRFAFFVAATPTQHACIVRLDLESREHACIKLSSTIAINKGDVSEATQVAFETTDGETAYGFFYPPANSAFEAPRGERPPLIVMSHGGPTAAAGAGFSLGTQFWTTRGFAVLDVNYRGSTGYGRKYREALDGNWGIVDVDDCVNGALNLVREGKVDPERIAITGGSAGGFTTLCALTFRDVFKAGASHYGVSDCEALAKDTHKFESRYLDRLIGPYPESKNVYYQRSPIHFTERLNAPVIFFQGLDDKIVPPDQAEKMVEALRAKGITVEYVTFVGEQHGFRQAENIKRALEDELGFFATVFGFGTG